jgi:hypothetical protein
MSSLFLYHNQVCTFSLYFCMNTNKIYFFKKQVFHPLHFSRTFVFAFSYPTLVPFLTSCTSRKIFSPRRIFRHMKEFLSQLSNSKCSHVRGIRAIMTSSFCRDFINASLQKESEIFSCIKYVKLIM